MGSTGSTVSWSVRLWRRGGPLVAAALVGSLVLSSCGWVESAAESVGISEESEEQDMRVELGPGETYQQQIDEIETVAEVMESRLGQGHVLRDGRTDTWTPEHHMENLRPNANCPGEDSLRNNVIFDYDDLDAEQAFAAGYEMAEDLGLAPNEAVNRDGTGERQMRFVASGEGGRSLIIGQQAGDDSTIEVFYNTKCSEHNSLQEAYDRIVGEQLEKDREERQKDREERLEELREG